MKRAALLILCLLSFSGCRESILHDLSETDANRVITSLGNRAIEAGKVREPDGTWAIEVDRSQAIAALRVLNDERVLREGGKLPPERSSSFASREEQRYRFERALSSEIAHTLTNIPGVIDARVHLNLPPLDPLFGQPLNGAKGSASVLVIAPETSIDTKEIAALVAGASGIPSETVSVLVSAKGAQESAEASPAEVLRPQPPPAVPEARGWLSQELLTQIAASLVIIGIALFVMLFRSAKKRAPVPFEA